jgi:hypothetical protein
MIDSKELLKLEQDILSIYEDGNPFNNHQTFMAAGLKSLLEKRKYLIDTGLRESYSIMDLGLADELFQFNNSLKHFLIGTYDTFRNIIEETKYGDQRLFQLSVYMANCPESMKQRNEYGCCLWDIFNNKLFNDDDFCTTPLIQNKLFSMTSIGYQDVDDESFEEEMKLSRPFANWNCKGSPNLDELEVIRPVEALIKNSCFAITDFAYCRDFRAEIKLNLGY